MSKPSKSEGYITFRKDRKKWEVRFYEFDPLTYKNKAKTKLLKDYEEAKKYLDSVMYQKENPLYIEHNGIPFCEMMKINQRLKLDTNQITEVTYLRNLQTIEQIEKYPIGKRMIDEITSEELQAFINSYKYLSNSTINKIYQQLGSTFKLAINKGYIMRNPMASVIKPKSDKLDKEVRAMTVEEQQMFTDYLLSKDLSVCKYKNVFLLQMYCGLRVSEALALTRNDINLRDNKIIVRRTLTKDEKGRVMMGQTTKTYAGKRILPLPEFLVDTIVEQMNLSETWNNNEEKMLFKPEDRKYVDRVNVNTELKRLLKRHFGIEDITTHSLRHTYGTRCIEAGMAPVVVQKLMGHTDVSITLNTYTSVFDKFKEKEIEKVNKYYMEENMLNAVKLLQEDSYNKFYDLEDTKEL